MNARPRRGTVRRTALCQHCDTVLYRQPGRFVDWVHDHTGQVECDPDDLPAHGPSSLLKERS